MLLFLTLFIYQSLAVRAHNDHAHYINCVLLARCLGLMQSFNNLCMHLGRCTHTTTVLCLSLIHILTFWKRKRLNASMRPKSFRVSKAWVKHRMLKIWWKLEIYKKSNKKCRNIIKITLEWSLKIYPLREIKKTKMHKVKWMNSTHK